MILAPVKLIFAVRVVSFLDNQRRHTAVDWLFTSLVIHVEGGQNLFAALPPSLLRSGADRGGIVSLHIPALSVTEPGD